MKRIVLTAVTLTTLAVAILGGKFLLEQPPISSPTASHPSENVAVFEAPSATLPDLPPAEALERIVESERFIREMTPKLADLTGSVLDLHLPKPTTRGWFEEESFVLDISGESSAESPAPANGLPLQIRRWALHDVPTSSFAESLDLYGPFLEKVDYFEHAKFWLSRGNFAGDDKTTWTGELGFTGLAKTREGQLLGVRATQDVTFRRRESPAEGAAPMWLISHWIVTKFETTEVEQPLFREVVDEVIPNAATWSRARQSIHETRVISNVRNGTLPSPLFTVETRDRHPGIAVVDIDGDGYDDIYLMARWGKNQLFRNRGDGTYEEIAEKLGLDIEEHTSSAVFADFDNDGDLDAFLGRTLERSLYLVNEEGTFVDRSSGRVAEPLPYFASSVSAADYNSDGLLDLYVTTFAGQLLSDVYLRGRYPKSVIQSRVRGKDGVELETLLAAPDAHLWLNWPGPPNILLRNIGSGRFVREDAPNPSALFRNTYQGSWSDYDGDGDPDLYCANDLAPDNLFRNDGGKFVDVTETAGINFMGFATGVSWGDYDADGRPDLYVTNVHSEAGKRITDQLGGLDHRYLKLADGNWLYRNTGDGFTKVSGPDTAYPVEPAGWGWGSQFIDVDNDGSLDVYALSGFFTAPKEVAVAHDSSSDHWRKLARTDPGLELPSSVTGEEPMPSPRDGASLSGHERNHLFLNRSGRFSDVSTVSGLDDLADGRSFAILDFNRDGWSDIAVANANTPLLQIFRNQSGRIVDEGAGHVIAIRLRGGNGTPEPSASWSARDAFGARIQLDVGSRILVRENFGSGGLAAQNSSTLLVGTGTEDSVISIEVIWPSGRKSRTESIESGSLVTAYENPLHSPNGEAFLVEPYKVFVPFEGSAVDVAVTRNTVARTSRRQNLPWLRNSSRSAINLYTTMTTSCQSCRFELPQFKLLRSEFSEAELAIYGLPMDENDDEQKLDEYIKTNAPSYKLLTDITADKRNSIQAIVEREFGGELLPATVIANSRGTILATIAGAPSVSAVRKLLRKTASAETENNRNPS